MRFAPIVLFFFIPNFVCGGTVDVNNLVEATGWASINPPTGRGQTFIPTMTGFLDAITLELGDVGTIKRGTSLEVFAVVDEEFEYLGESYLWLNPGFNLTRYTYNFSNLMLTEGKPYAWVLFGEDIRIGGTYLDLPNSSPLVYAEGQWAIRGGELVFATSMSAVPESATLSLLVVGMVGIMISRRFA